MKRFFLVFIGLISVSPAFAQGSTDWRPSLADDNKAATLEGTQAFLKGISMTKENTTVPNGGELFVTNFDTAAMCTIHLTRGVKEGYESMVVDSVKLDLSAVDPLSVTVKTQQDGNGHIPYFVILTGTNNAIFVTGDRAFYDHQMLSYKEYSVATAPCMAGKQKGKPGNEWTQTIAGDCRSRLISDYSYSFPFGDRETAKRFARGMMHAALMCGGNKAVSPF
jgi:hypothetical protein